MKKRRLVSLLAVLVGIFMIWNFSSVSASEVIFQDLNLTRETLQTIAQNNTLNASSETLSISKTRSTGDYYNWDPTTTSDGKTVWKIAKGTGSSRDYSNLYYCLNVAKGFGYNSSTGDMTEGASATYVYDTDNDMKDSSKQSSISTAAGGNLGTNYNKVVWILDHAYIPTGSSSYKTSSDYTTLMRNAGITVENEAWDLTEEDIDVVQQMAIWYFTNSSTSGYNGTSLPSLYINGRQLSSIYYGTDEDGMQITGAQKQQKANKLYQYFLNNASSSYTAAVPTLTLGNAGTTVEESGNYYMVGPFQLTGTNTSEIDEINTTVNKTYTLLDGSKNVVTGNQFKNVVGGNFYLRLNKSDVTTTTPITINMQYTYNTRQLIFMTNTGNTNQPVVHVKEGDVTKPTSTNYTIQTTQVEVEKVWDDESNKDGVRPASVTVALYEGSTKKAEQTLSASNNWKYTWTGLLAGKTYTVRELNTSGSIIAPNDAYNEDYVKVTYGISGTKTIVTNKHTPEPDMPDLALRKFITKIGGSPVESREPQITSEETRKLANKTATFDEGTTAAKTHTKTPLEVKTDDVVTYTIRVYNEGNIDAYASEITDYLPAGLAYIPDSTVNTAYGWKMYDASGAETTDASAAKYIKTNYLSRTNTENILTAFAGGDLDYKDVEVECKVIAEEQITNNLRNVAAITGMTDKNGNTITDIDSQPQAVNPDTYHPEAATQGKGEQDDDDYEDLLLKERELDLALRKFITGLNDDAITTQEPQVDTSTIATTGTATYKHEKTPVAVQIGDIVTYTIRVYNEGEVNGYVSEITDYLPAWLDFLPDDEINRQYLWAQDVDNPRKITTNVAQKDSATGETIYEARENKQLLAAYNGGDTLDYIDVKIRCQVNDQAKEDILMTNIAEISGMQKADGSAVETDRDSTRGDVVLPEDSNLPDYKGHDDNKADLTDDNYYYKGQQDDDDFAKVIIKRFDLSLKKFATTVVTKAKDETSTDTVRNYQREPVVDASKLGTKDENGNIITEAVYTMDKTPIRVSKGDIITYILRIYNEGDLAGYANEIIDYIPEGLRFVEDSTINEQYGWTQDGDTIKTNYLSNSNTENELKAVTTDENGNKVLDYKDVQVQFEIVADPAVYVGKTITNWAEINDESNKDIDSTPGNEDRNEDDIDYEPVVLGYFDLALRKFITKVDNTDYNNRVPQVDASKLGTFDENGKLITKATYTHTKDPVLLQIGNTVVYTIRIYNEGTMDGYAEEITDNIPEELEFLPDNEVNKEYKWTMIDENGEITTDVSKATKITTNYLSEANDRSNIISAYQTNNGSVALDYKDVKVAFKVSSRAKPQKVIVNTAEISEDSGDDIDSTPDNNKDGEDDIDKEYVKVQTFDLALKKWVTATKVTYKGKTKTTKTGFNEDSTEMAKVDLVASRLKKTTVKFVYNIKVINEGEVAGYAYEVKDYIPSGLKFIKADNPKWKLQKDGTVTTDQLKSKLLQPGESATIQIVLTWKNSTSNMGAKTNWAEISKDSGDDIDSTPDNYKKTEDDIDNAIVILSIKTGKIKTYIALATASVSILAAGAYIIRKKVL